MKCLLQKLQYKLGPYYDVVIFAVTLLVANGLWKLTIGGDEHGDYVTLFGLDVSPFFAAVTQHVADAVYGCVHLVRDTVHLTGRRVWFDSGNGSRIVWGCSGIKQAWIWFALMLTTRGRWLHKLWFIPLGWLICHGFNILRISLISLFIEFHPERFHFLHDYLFKYLFYGLMFLLWVLWIEKLTINTSLSEASQSINN